MHKTLPLIRVGLVLLILVNLWGAYAAIHGLPAAILANDNPTQNTDGFFWSVISAVVWGIVLAALLRIPTKPRPKKPSDQS